MAEDQFLDAILEESKKLKRDLENWREIILPIHSILLAEKNSHVAIIFGATSVLFFMLWQTNLSLLSILSVLGIVFTVVDYLLPVLALHFHHSENWTSAKEKKLELICLSLAKNKIYFLDFLKTFYQMKRDRPKCYYTIVLVTLFTFFWIGNAVNNLFLTYLIVTTLLLLPGIKHHELIQNKVCIAYLYKLILNKSQQSLKKE